MAHRIVIVMLGAIVAGFVQGLSGFAFGLVAMSFWVWTVEPRLAATLVVFGSLMGQIAAAFSVRRGFDARQLAPLLLGGLVGLPIGLAILPKVDVRLLKAILGILLVVWCPLMLAAAQIPRLTRGGRIADSLAGMIGGVLGVVAGLTGAVPALWCTLRRLDKDTQRALIQNYNLVMLSLTMAIYIGRGDVTSGMLPLLAMVAIAMLIPTLFGIKLYGEVSEATFRTIVLALLTGSGVALLVSALKA